MALNELHIGKLVEERIAELGMSKAEFGRRMATSRQNVNTLLRKSDWQGSQIIMASNVLKKNFFEPLSRELRFRLGEVGSIKTGKEKGFRFLVEVEGEEQLGRVMAVLQGSGGDGE